MPKRLSGSAGTGKKIMQNLNQFSFNYRNSENIAEKVFYTFDWSFGNQSGSAVIKLTDSGYIDQSSTLNCNKNCYDFSRPLGAYNDDTLYDVFGMMLRSQNINYK